MSEHESDVDDFGDAQPPEDVPEPESAPEHVESDTDLDATGLDRPSRHFESFAGPAQSFTLTREPDPSTVEVSRDEPVAVTVDGRVVRRAGGHFGRGRWTVTYRT